MPRTQHTNRTATALIAAAALCCTTAATLAQTARVIDLGSLGGQTRAAAINPAGAVVGTSIGTIDSGSRFHAFRWDSTIHALEPLSGDRDSHAFALNANGTTFGMSFAVGELGTRAFVAPLNQTPTLLGDFAARGANNAGVVVGSRIDTTATGLRTNTACQFRNNTLTSLPGLGGTTSSAAAIADTDDIVGWASTTNDQNTHAVLWRNDIAHDLGTLGGSYSQALAVNNHGMIAGVAQTAGGERHAFLFETDSSGSVTARHDLGTLGSTASTALGINDAGHVVGTSNDRAFRYADNQLTDLNTLLPNNSTWQLQGATAINDTGLIAGWGKHRGTPAAFLFTPCGADFNNDSSVDTRDVLSFLNAWVAQHTSADFNDDASVNTLDLLAFLNAWNTGC